MTRAEILKLHELDDDSMVDWLYTHDVLELRFPDDGLYESLADCAFRLRDEMGIEANFYFIEMWYKVTGQTFTRTDISKYYVPEWVSQSAYNWGLFEAQPIHWIQAALLALLKGETG